MQAQAHTSRMGPLFAVLLGILVVMRTGTAVGDDDPTSGSRTNSLLNGTVFDQDSPAVPGPIATPPSSQPANQSQSLTDAAPSIANACSPICCVDLLSIAPNLIGANFGAGTGNIDFANIPHATVAKLVVPNAAESVLGRQTIGDDSSPMPHDRFFFDYDYLYSVPFSPGGNVVDRFVSGFEKTFFDGQVSAEVRLPFGTTLDNDLVVKPKVVHGITHWNYRTGYETLLGNVAVGAKAVLFHIPDELAISAGLLVTLPTASDLSVAGLLAPLSSASATLRIKNESVHIGPYLGALWTPTDRLFLQGFFQVDFDANGQEVVLENGGSSSDLGRDRDQTFAYFDAGVGYWIVRESGINWAALFEVHYSASLDSPKAFDVSPAKVTLQSADGSINLVDLTLGTSLQVQDNKTLSLAYIFAVGAGGDEQFTRELRATFNWYF
jgi:hypothetical protein